MAEGTKDSTELVEILGKAANGKVDADLVKRLASMMRRSLKITRRGVGLSGQGVADLLLNVAPRIPIRSAETLSEQYGGMTGPALAGHVIRHASRHSAAVGGATGAIASVHSLLPPFWLMLPAELLAETLIVASIEMKLVAELHEIYGHPITGDASQRGAAIVQAWSERRGVRVEDLAYTGTPGKSLGRGAKSHIIQMVRRRLIARATRNVSSLAPLLIGAVAGAEVNRRATRDLGNAVVRDLALPVP